MPSTSWSDVVAPMELYVRFVVFAWWALLLLALLLVFSMIDTRWNTDYHFDVPPLPKELSEGELEKAHPTIMGLLKELKKRKQPQPQLVALLMNELKDAHSSLPTDLIKKNLKKVQAEIGQKSSHTAEQFNNKFLLVGGLFALIVVYFTESFKKGNLDKDLEALCQTNLICAILAISVIICISLDMYERANLGISNAHAEWIVRYIETPILGAASQCNGHNNDGPRNGWESSLRITHDDSTECKPVDGLHHDRWGHLLFAIQYHYLTIVLYFIYVGLLYSAFSKNTKLIEDKFQCRIALMLLVIVQTSILAFAIITRESTEIVEIKVIPVGLEWLSQIFQNLSDLLVTEIGDHKEAADLVHRLFGSGNVEWLAGFDALKMAFTIGVLPWLWVSCLTWRLFQGAFVPKAS